MRTFIAIFLLLSLHWACTNPEGVPIDQSTPEATTKGFFEALGQGDYELAKRYGTESTQQSVQHFNTNLKMISPEEKQALEDPFKVAIEGVNCTDEQGNTTCVVVYQNQGEVRAELVQQNEQWFVQLELNF